MRWLITGFWFLLGGWLTPAWAQAPKGPPLDVTLLPGPAKVLVTEEYTLAFRLRGAALEGYSAFPEIEGFKKSKRTSTTTTRSVQGRTFSELTITQHYLPYGEGEFAIKPFQMTVNGQKVRSSGATVRVEYAPAATPPATPPGTAPAAAQGQPLAVGSLDQLFGKPKPALYQELPDKAFLAVEANRPRVYVGEGVRVGLYFFLTPADQALLAFHDFDDQLPRLLQQLHQTTAWEVAATEPSVTPDTVRRGGQLYMRYRLAEATYYPLNTQPLRFPPLALTMTKFKMLKKPEPGTDNRLAFYKTYYSPGVSVAVRPLPPLAATEHVAVGAYAMREAISRRTVRVGQTFDFTFGVEGRGNLAAVLPPTATPRPGLQVYGPDMRVVPAPGGGRKLFRYRLVPRRPGPLPLDSMFRLVVFNPATSLYDTLRPTLKPVVQGAAQAVELPKPEEDPFYGPALAGADTELQPLNVYGDVRRYATWLLGGLLLLALAGWWRAGR